MANSIGQVIKDEICPNGHQIVYNGNFFCTEFGMNQCWALSHLDKKSKFDIAFHDRHGWNCCPNYKPTPVAEES